MPIDRFEPLTENFKIVENISGAEGEVSGLVVIQNNRMHATTHSLVQAAETLDKIGDPNLGLITIITDEHYLSASGINAIIKLQDYIRVIGTFGTSQRRHQNPARSPMEIILPELVNADQTPIATLKEPGLPFIPRSRDRLTRRLSLFDGEFGKVAIRGNRFTLTLPEEHF